jgi:hypothetical protein
MVDKAREDQLEREWQIDYNMKEPHKGVDNPNFECGLVYHKQVFFNSLITGNCTIFLSLVLYHKILKRLRRFIIQDLRLSNMLSSHKNILLGEHLAHKLLYN